MVIIPSNFKLKFKNNNEENFKWHEIEDKKILEKIKLSDTIFIKFESRIRGWYIY
jgi:hypothetical protein